jgi:hypothetical protein
MAAITSANVTKYHIRRVIDASGAQYELEFDAAIVLSGQGGTANDIPASALGLVRIHEVTGGILNASSTITANWVATDFYTNTTGGAGGSEIITFPYGSGGSRGNLTGTLYVRVRGID